MKLFSNSITCRKLGHTYPSFISRFFFKIFFLVYVDSAQGKLQPYFLNKPYPSHMQYTHIWFPANYVYILSMIFLSLNRIPLTFNILTLIPCQSCLYSLHDFPIFKPYPSHIQYTYTGSLPIMFIFSP